MQRGGRRVRRVLTGAAERKGVSQEDSEERRYLSLCQAESIGEGFKKEKFSSFFFPASRIS